MAEVNDQGTFLAYRNHLENTGTVFVTKSEGLREPSNVLTRESDDFWRIGGLSAGATSADVIAEMVEDSPVDVVSIQFPRGTYPGVSEDNPNFKDGDTVRYRLLDSVDTELWDSGPLTGLVVPGYMTHFVEIPSTIMARKIHIEFDVPSRAEQGFFDVGNIGAWPVIRPRVGFAYPAKFGWRINKEINRTSAGRLYTARFEPMRRWSLAFDHLSIDDSLEIEEMVRYSGGARQLFVRRGDLPPGKDSMLALIMSDADFDSITWQIRQHTLTLEEFI